MSNRWHNIPGHIVRELAIDNSGHIIDVDTGLRPTMLDNWYFSRCGTLFETAELVINFKSSGEYIPQTWESPEEYSDERLMVSVVFAPDNGSNITVPTDVAQSVFDMFETDVYKSTLDNG